MLFDTHAHISDPRFDRDRDEVLARATAAGVGMLVDVAVCLSTSRRTVRTASQEPRILAAVGIDPHTADAVDASALSELRALAASPRVCAIGETGLDFYRNRSTREGQLRSLRAQLELASLRGLPVILHLRSSAKPGEGSGDAYDTGLEVLRDYRGELTAISHCFSGVVRHAEALVELGHYVSFAGNVTYPKAETLREAAGAVPLDRILLETDCPYLSPQVRRGKRNEPAHVRHTAEAIAEVRGIGFEELAAAATANARRVFRIDEHGCPRRGPDPDEVVAAGFCVWRPGADGAPRFLLLQHADAGHWSPPKGHLDPGETIDQAAVRETQEETGLPPETLAPAEGFRREVRYRVVKDGARARKVVVYGLARAAAGAEVALSAEHTAAAWLPLDAACERVRFRNLQAILREAARYLRSEERAGERANVCT